MSRPFYSDAKTSHFLFPRDFSGTIEDTDIINTILIHRQNRFGTEVCLLGVTNPKRKI